MKAIKAKTALLVLKIVLVEMVKLAATEYVALLECTVVMVLVNAIKAKIVELVPKIACAALDAFAKIIDVL